MQRRTTKRILAASMAFAVVPTIAIGFSGPAAAEQANVRTGAGCDLTPPEPFAGPGASHGLVDAKAAWAWTQRSDTALSRLGALSKGEGGSFMGLQLDHRNRQVELVYSRDLPQAEIDSLAKAADAAVAGAFTVSLTPSCYAKGEVEEALGVLNGLAWDTKGPVLGSWGYRADDGRVEVTLPEDAQTEGQRLKEQLGDRIVVKHSPASGFSRLAGRYADESPFSAGALIVGPTGGCSSGIAMNVGGRRWSTTSGHCATAEGQTFTTGDGKYFGTNRQRRFPDPDLMLVGSSAGNYSNRIYADTMRRVTSKISNGAVNFCLSGQETRNICSIQSDWDNATFCDSQGCTFHLYRVRHTTAGTLIGRPGDSGGPAYGRSGTFEASARGSIVSTDDGGFTLYLHNVGTMESVFGGTIAFD